MSHEDFRPIGDAEFRERFPVDSRPSTSNPVVCNESRNGYKQTESTKASPEDKALRKGNDIARRAATLCWRISNEEPDPTKWKARIEAAPEELRECLREYLKQKYRAMQHKAKPKQSAAGDAALAALAKRYGQP